MVAATAIQTASQSVGMFIGARLDRLLHLMMYEPRLFRLSVIQVPDRLRLDLCGKRGAHAGFRNLVPALPRPAHFALQLALVLRCHHVRLFHPASRLHQILT